MPGRRLVFRLHAVQRMAARSISEDEVRFVVETGEIVENYPEDAPFASRLLRGWVGSRPIHVVAADVPSSDQTIVITVYEPDLGRWYPDFLTRR